MKTSAGQLASVKTMALGMCSNGVLRSIVSLTEKKSGDVCEYRGASEVEIRHRESLL